MPLPSTPTEQEPTEPQAKSLSVPSGESAGDEDLQPPLATSLRSAEAPVSFVPHTADGTISDRPVRIRTPRYGELEEHELIRLLGDIEDERARSRFRESIYISLFVWMAIAWVIFYGPRYLWHAPKLILPSDVLRERALTRLEAPKLSSPLPRTGAAPAPRAAPRVDNRTLEHLRETAPKPAAPTRVPESPRPATPVLPPSARPNLPLPAAPRPTPPVVAEAPTPQPATRPNFNTGGSAGDSIQSAIQGAARNRGGSGAALGGNSSGSGLGGVEVLSDRQGVDFDPYIRRILREIYDHWLPLIPEEARPPISKSGVTMIRFSILPDGNIGSMNLDGSTHDEALNKAAWGSITSVGQFPALPGQFHGPKLELRIHYLVNRKDE